MIGDTIQFTSTNPYKFVITGRTKYFINAFGEELIMDNAEKGLAYAARRRVRRLLNIPLLLSIWTAMPSVATSGSSSSLRNQRI